MGRGAIYGALLSVGCTSNATEPSESQKGGTNGSQVITISAQSAEARYVGVIQRKEDTGPDRTLSTPGMEIKAAPATGTGSLKDVAPQATSLRPSSNSDDYG